MKYKGINMKHKYLVSILILLIFFLLVSCKNTETHLPVEQPKEIDSATEKTNQIEKEVLDEANTNQPETNNLDEENTPLDDTTDIESSENEEMDNAESLVEPERTNNIIKNCMSIISQEGLNLRDQPMINSGKIVLMPYDSEVIILDEEKAKDTIDNIKGNWIKVKYNNVEGWAFDAYLDCIVDRNDIKTGDIINGLEVTVKQAGNVIEFQGEISLTGELLMNNSYAVLIPDKEYLKTLPKFDEGNEIFYFHLRNFRETANELNLSSNTYSVSAELNGYSIGSTIKGNKSIPEYRTEIISINEFKVKEISEYDGKSIESYYITEEVQIKDIICGLQVIFICVINDKYDPNYPHYIGSVGFKGEMTLNCSYLYYDGDYFTGGSGYIFHILEEDYNKIPHFKGQETPHFEIGNIDEDTKDKLGKKGTAKIKVNDYNYYWEPKEHTSTAELLEIITVEKEEDFE